MTSMPDAGEKPMLAHALEYVGLGYPVFPVCSPRMGTHEHAGKPCTNPGKRPLVAWEPYQSRLPTEGEVRVWWTRWPLANIGMATGIVSGVVVLDCDGTEARQLALSKGGLDRTPAVWTGKVGGVHYHLRHPDEAVRNFARRLPGLDFRGDGGYVLLPPSVHASGASYRWNENTLGMRPAPIPDWLWGLLRERATEAGAPGEFNPDDAIDAEEAVRGFDQGERDTRLWSFAGWLRHHDYPLAIAEALIAEAARNCRPPFDEDDAVEKVRRAFREYEPGGSGPDVEDEGWFSPPKAGMAVTPEPLAPPAVFFRPISELLAMPEVEPDWMVDQLFTVASNGWVAAEPKVGKSWIVLELAYALATGMPFLGRFAVKQPRRVLYVQEEDSLQRVLRRLKKIIKGDASRPFPSDDYWRWSIRAGFKLDNLTWLEMLRQEIISFKAEVIILDVFNRLHGSDENKQPEMTAILNNLTRLTNDYGCAFIIVHHNRKSQQGDEARANQKIRGSGVLAGWSECSLYLRRAKEQHTIIVTPESKDAPEMDDFEIVLTDTDNGGMFLQVGERKPDEHLTKGDADTIEAVRRLSGRGIGATVQAVARELDKDRTTSQKRLTRLVEAGYLTATPISDTPNPTKIYEVVEQ